MVWVKVGKDTYLRIFIIYIIYKILCGRYPKILWTHTLQAFLFSIEKRRKCLTLWAIL